MNTMKGRDILALGFMTFALFVGAGNIIFPPFIGWQAGEHVWIAAIGFLLTAVGLPVITIVAIARVGGSMSTLSAPIGKVASLILAIVCYLAIGPLFAGPRTATVSFDIGVLPFLSKPEGQVGSELFIYTILYFIVVLGVSLHPTKLLDSVGNILAPIKIIALAILGITAIVAPAGEVSEAVKIYQQTPFSQGFVNGYLTMDTLASLAFGILVVNAIRSRGIESETLITRYAVIAGLIAGVGLALVYICLFKLGNNSNVLLTQMNVETGAPILQKYVHHVFGDVGAVFLSVLICIACLVTAIGVTSACASFFATILPFSYRKIVIVIVLVTFGISNFGLAELIKITGPVLVAIYPPCIVLVLLSFIKRLWRNCGLVFSLTMLVSLVFGVFDGIKAAGFSTPAWIESLPLAQESLAWLVPSLIVVVLCTIIDRLYPAKAVTNA